MPLRQKLLGVMILPGALALLPIGAPNHGKEAASTKVRRTSSMSRPTPLHGTLRGALGRRTRGIAKARVGLGTLLVASEGLHIRHYVNIYWDAYPFQLFQCLRWDIHAWQSGGDDRAMPGQYMQDGTLGACALR